MSDSGAVEQIPFSYNEALARLNSDSDLPASSGERAAKPPMPYEEALKRLDSQSQLEDPEQSEDPQAVIRRLQEEQAEAAAALAAATAAREQAQAEEAARLAAEQKAHEEAEAAAAEAEQLAREIAAQEEADRLAEEQRAREEAEAAAAEAGRLAAEQKAREEAEAAAAAEAARLEAERLEAEQKAREEAEAAAAEAARQEAERIAREEAEAAEAARIAAEQKAREEEEARLAAEQRAREEEEARLAAEEKARQEEAARQEAARRAAEEARAAAERQEAERRKQEAERQEAEREIEEARKRAEADLAARRKVQEEVPRLPLADHFDHVDRSTQEKVAAWAKKANLEAMLAVFRVLHEDTVRMALSHICSANLNLPEPQRTQHYQAIHAAQTQADVLVKRTSGGTLPRGGSGIPVFAKRANQSSHPPLSGAFAAPTEAVGSASPSQNGHKRSESIEQLVDRLSQPKKAVDEDTKEKIQKEAEHRRSKSRERGSKLMQNPVLFGGIDTHSAEASETGAGETSQRSKNETKVGFKESPDDFLARLSAPKATAPEHIKEKVQQEAERRRAKSRERSGTTGDDEKKPTGVLSPSVSTEKVAEKPADEERGRSRAQKPVNAPVSASSSSSSFLDRLSKPTASSASKTAAKPISASSSKTSIKSATSVDSLRAARK